MNLNKLSDRDLLKRTIKLVKHEREILTHILSSLREVEQRRLYSELGYKSLFEYAVKQLKYSEGQAGRRIQALRLIKEIPTVKKKIECGKLSLSNICHAQSFFRETKNNTKTANLKIEEKIEILQKLENKSSRDGQKLLMSLSPEMALPKEKIRSIDDQHTQVSFVINEELNFKLESIRSLLPPSEQNIPLAELINIMAGHSLQVLKEKKFGKKRSTGNAVKAKKLQIESVKTTPPPELQGVKSKSRYISKAVKYHIYHRDEFKCKHCSSKKNLNIDHIKPLGKGGLTEVSNLRLLCFSCNQRAAIKSYGLTKILASMKP